ncbi:Cloroperoxidase [Massarina eburnea CBS 473.64]|uniref:Cloroperoxidase n=1 Tax=Massarina eburnea CBS 473.64 TaxID=1395130 RepID=A0A6A6RQ40_9PLEO|nr:Cloroperoxidase [Massarina eburnea CBS 473.64]
MTKSILTLTLVVLAGTVQGQGSYETWHGPGPNDSRGPCPMLNTLSNHDFLPHDGRNFNLSTVKNALKNALNFSEDLGSFLHGQALATNPNGTTWGLDTLSTHNILEHDASLTRADNFWSNDAVTFNATVFNQTRSWWTADLIDLQMVANARLGRLLDSAKYNRDFSISDLATSFSAGEGAAYLMVFANNGNRSEGLSRKDLVTYLFENERLPLELGWNTPSPAITKEELLTNIHRVVNATVYKPELFE